TQGRARAARPIHSRRPALEGGGPGFTGIRERILSRGGARSMPIYFSGAFPRPFLRAAGRPARDPADHSLKCLAAQTGQIPCEKMVWARRDTYCSIGTQVSSRSRMFLQ